MTGKAMLTAAEACALLGIKPQTLYAYVSRGLLRAESHPGMTGKLYARDELEALQARSRARAGHGPTAASAMRWGDPILDSAITCIQAGQIYYRGYSLLELLRRFTSFEQVSELLWSGELPLQRVLWSPPMLPRTFPQQSESMLSRRLLLRLSELALADPEGHDELIDQTLRRARAVILTAVDEIFPLAEALPHLPIAARIALAINQDKPEVIDAISCALIVSADHELNASTFAGRVAASTGADLYASMLAALASFSGRHHGLASQEVFDFITDPPARLGPTVPGFGHRLYPDGDPRVEPLLQCARTLAPDRWQKLEHLINQAKQKGYPKPNLDFALVAVALALDLPRDGASALFVLGRLAGWTAHVIEQRQQGFLLRPRARYIGRAPTLSH
jgi:citrate synthase